MYSLSKDSSISRHIENTSLPSPKILSPAKKSIHLGFDENTPRNTDTMVNCRNWGGGAQSSFRMLLLRLIFFSTLTYLVVKFKWLILILITGYIHLCKNKGGGGAYDPTPFFKCLCIVHQDVCIFIIMKL